MTDTETNSDDGAAIEAAPFPLRPHQINVIGFTGHRTLAPWGSPGPGIEFWGCNALWESGIEWQKCTRWFDPHPREVIEGMPNHVAWLKERRDMTVYLLDAWTDLCPSAERLPIERLRDGLGTTYFTNTISYMIGLAILELIPAANAWKESQRTEYPEGRRASSSAPPQPEIGIYGVDMATTSEYGAQRPSCELFIGMALGLGIKVTIPPQSDLMKSAGMYGVSDNGELRAKMLHRKAEIEGLIGQMQQERGAVVNHLGQLDGGIARHQGHISEIDYWLNVWTMPGTGGNREAASLPGQLDPVEPGRG